MLTPELVLLGGPNSGKTHYAGQLYGRLRRRPGLLRIRDDQGTPPDLSALEQVLLCLESGHAAEHTPAGTWAEVLLPLEDGQGKPMNLLWPDYAGEQLRTVFDQRQVSEAWQARLGKAQGWLLFIRLKSETTYPDRMSELAQRQESNNGSGDGKVESWDANAYWVELLQILLHVAGHGTVSRLSQPRLTVLLSCYDELESIDHLPPKEIFAQRLPLVSAFIDSVWHSNAASIWGLSALGRLLDKNSADERFIDEGPEYQGWIVPPEGGDSDSDLSRPLAWLLEG
jgi:hypothetical protein